MSSCVCIHSVARRPSYPRCRSEVILIDTDEHLTIVAANTTIWSFIAVFFHGLFELLAWRFTVVFAGTDDLGFRVPFVRIVALSRSKFVYAFAYGDLVFASTKTLFMLVLFQRVQALTGVLTSVL